MAAVPVSPHNCTRCAATLDHFLSRHVCPACGAPQPIAPDESYFSAFGVNRRFAQDLSLVEKRFYEISRALHPDRFTGSDAQSRLMSLDRMSFLNQAYQTLRKRELLREYFLKQFGFAGDANAPGGTAARGQVPMELAESWFELQDALTEDPQEAAEKLRAFESDLRELKAGSEAKLRDRETAVDQAMAAFEESGDDSRVRAQLESMAKEIQAQSYLRSMERDVERIKKGFQKP